MLVLGLALLGSASPSGAVEPIKLTNEQDRIEITPLAQVHPPQGDRLQVEGASADGLQARMTVTAAVPGTSPRWLVFSLTNTSPAPIERLLTSERYALVGSGVIWPDLDTRRIEAVTPSRGFLPERVRNDRADIFRVSLETGQTVTYVVELATDRVPRVHLWKPVPYELKARDRQLFNGILLGIVGVLGIFLTSVFAANHKGIFPAAALVAWTLLAYLCVDFGFFHKLFNLRVEDNAVYRAATESAVAASLVIFLTTFLRAHAWPSFARMLAVLWIVAHLSLVAVAVVDPRLAATFARASFVAIGGIGSLLIFYFFVRGQDRALALIPTWILFLVFIYGAYVAMSGRLGGEIVVSSFAASLVLLAVLIGFTVTQFAFRSGDIAFVSRPGARGDGGASELAIDLSRSAIWEWRAGANEIKVGTSLENRLGHVAGELSGKVEAFVRHLHPADRDKFLTQLWSTQERGRGVIAVDMRLRHADNSYVWVGLEAASIDRDGERDLQCIGLIRDINEQKSVQERLIHDAVSDSRTGLPNRALLLDRIAVALRGGPVTPASRTVVMVLGIDKFSERNARFGRVVGDTLLQTTARRIQLHLRPEDTLARIGGDQFGMLIRSETDPKAAMLLAERIRGAIQAPTSVVGEDVVLTGSLGIAFADETTPTAGQLLANAEVAMQRAKRDGANRYEVFTDDLVTMPDQRLATAAELVTAIEREQLRLEYQPIVYLATEELVGFEALVRWEHPKLGMLMPDEFIGLAEAHDLTPRLGAYVLARAAEDAARWRQQFPRSEKPLFIAVNVSSQQLLRDGLVTDVRRTMSRHGFEPGVLRLEITETMVMDNPEQATEMLAHLKAAGVSLAMDDFGTGYSSLAYLQKFPFDVIKIDRALVQSCGTDAAGSAIVRSIVALAHELGRKVVAEGVEDADDAAFLRSIRCDFAQGFHFGEAQPLKETIAYLKFVTKTERKLGKRGLKAGPSPRIIDEATTTKTLSGVLARARQKPSAGTVTGKGGTPGKQPASAARAPVPMAPRPAPIEPPAAAPPELGTGLGQSWPAPQPLTPRASGPLPPLSATEPPFPSDPPVALDRSESAPFQWSKPTDEPPAAPTSQYQPHQSAPSFTESMAAALSTPAEPLAIQPMPWEHARNDDAPPPSASRDAPPGDPASITAAMSAAMSAIAPLETAPSGPIDPLHLKSHQPLSFGAPNGSGTLPFDDLPALTSLPPVPVGPQPLTPPVPVMSPAPEPLPTVVPQRQLRPIPRPRPATKGLPPRIAQSLARLAGETAVGDEPPQNQKPGPPRAAE